MKRLFIILLFFITLTCVSQAKSVYEIFVAQEGTTQGNKCQAVRLNKEWFLTAAHCLTPVCKDKCTIIVKLLPTNAFTIQMQTQHNFSNKSVFLHPEAEIKQASYDIALIKFKTDSPLIFTDNKYNYTEKQFLELFPKAQEAIEEARKFTPPSSIFIIKNTPFLKTPKRLKRDLLVDSIWDTDKSSLRSKTNVFYSPTKKFIYTQNFGIRQGISGSGVFTNQQELIAVVSSVASTEIVKGYQKIKDLNLSIFSTFDEITESFLKQHIPNINYKNASFSDFDIVPDDSLIITQSLEENNV